MAITAAPVDLIRRADKPAGDANDITDTEFDTFSAAIETALNELDAATDANTSAIAAAPGTVTSVAASVPTGLAISGSPITSSGTLAISLDTGYVIPTQAALDAKLSSSLATEITTSKTTLVTADQIIILDSAASDAPKLATMLTLRAKQVGSGLGTTGTVNLDFASIGGTVQTISATGNITFTTSNLAAGRTLELRIAANGATRTLTWPSWVAFGAALPTSITTGEVLRVALQSTGTTDAGVDATGIVSV